jgi:hypothetical protein
MAWRSRDRDRDPAQTAIPAGTGTYFTYILLWQPRSV